MKIIKKDKGVDLVKTADLTEESARKMLEKIRWPEGPICPRCQSKEIVIVTGKGVRAGLYRCKECRRSKAQRNQFTVTVGTVFEQTHIPLRKWVMAFHLMCSSKKGISALQLKRNLGLSYKSAWHLAHRIRYAMQEEPLASLLGGTVEADETYVGGKPRNSRKGSLPNPTGKSGRHIPKKNPVAVLVERGGDVISFPIKRVSAKALKEAIHRHVDQKNTTLMTDEAPVYVGVGREFTGGHQTVMHSGGEYVRDDAHIQTAESYFALLKRGVNGTFHHVSEKHLGRYCDEFSFRWNHRKIDDGLRTVCAISGAEGKRLMYREPIRA